MTMVLVRTGLQPPQETASRFFNATLGVGRYGIGEGVRASIAMLKKE
jgi:hypothetical protein